MDIQFITLGTTCVPAAALRYLNLRQFALPFDWVNINAQQLCAIIQNNFEGYHNRLWAGPTQIVDGYGVIFPHDYPTVEQKDLTIDEEAHIGGITERAIQPGWEAHVGVVQEKYARRIERFHSLLSSEKPLIALYSGPLKDVPMIRETFITRYHKRNIVFVVSTKDPSSDPLIVTCDPFHDGIWNDEIEWMKGIETAREIVATRL